jgi:ribose transport system ATP-binding protein
LSAARLEVVDLSKTFGSARVLRDVHVDVAPGEVHGLVGQNGCGKSTLVKILTGVYTPDPGATITVDGQLLGLPIQPAEQRAAGVSVVHQNLGLVDDLTVWENIRVGRYRAHRVTRFLDRRSERAVAADVLERLGRTLDVDDRVGELSAEDRATVAIARAVQDHRSGAGLIIFDESTRALGREARTRFFGMVEHVVAEGASVLLISHQLEEVVEVTDRVTVLRDGAVVEAGIPTATIDEAGLVRLMIGRHVVTQRHSVSHAQDDAIAEVKSLSIGEVEQFDLTIRRGEIIGLTGLMGSGYADVAEAVAGASRAVAGTLRIGEHELDLARRRGSSAAFIEAGVGYVPERRLDAGVAADMTVTENLTLPRLLTQGHRLVIGRAWQTEEAGAMIAQLDIRPPDPQAAVGTLSGGNQQKVLLGKWLAGSPQLLVLNEPTQAVDVGARHDIVEAVRESAGQGCGVLVASIDAGDLSVLCDRVLVFEHGAVVAELSGDLSADQIIDATFEKSEAQ